MPATARVRPAGVLSGLALGTVATWLLVLGMPTLLLPAASVLAAAALAWRWRRDVAIGLAVGALAVTAVLARLLSVVGSGLQGV